MDHSSFSATFPGSAAPGKNESDAEWLARFPPLPSPPPHLLVAAGLAGTSASMAAAALQADAALDGVMVVPAYGDVQVTRPTTTTPHFSALSYDWDPNLAPQPATDTEDLSPLYDVLPELALFNPLDPALWPTVLPRPFAPMEDHGATTVDPLQLYLTDQPTHVDEQRSAAAYGSDLAYVYPTMPVDDQSSAAADSSGVYDVDGFGYLDDTTVDPLDDDYANTSASVDDEAGAAVDAVDLKSVVTTSLVSEEEHEGEDEVEDEVKDDGEDDGEDELDETDEEAEEQRYTAPREERAVSDLRADKKTATTEEAAAASRPVGKRSNAEVEIREITFDLAGYGVPASAPPGLNKLDRVRRPGAVLAQFTSAVTTEIDELKTRLREEEREARKRDDKTRLQIKLRLHCPVQDDCPLSVDKARLVRHINSVHRADSEQPRCSVCGTTSSRDDALKRHEKTCRGDQKEGEPIPRAKKRKRGDDDEAPCSSASKKSQRAKGTSKRKA